MAGTNDCLMFAPDGLSGLGFSDLPKGDLVRLGVNPYNGNAVMRFQGNDRAVDAADAIFSYIAETVAELSNVQGRPCGFRDFVEWVGRGSDLAELGRFALCPECGQEPSYDEEAHTLVCGCGAESPYRFADADQALEVWNFTRDYRSAA